MSEYTPEYTSAVLRAIREAGRAEYVAQLIEHYGNSADAAAEICEMIDAIEADTKECARWACNIGRVRGGK